jgi:hypothetical protein
MYINQYIIFVFFLYLISCRIIDALEKNQPHHLPMNLHEKFSNLLLGRDGLITLPISSCLSIAPRALMTLPMIRRLSIT